ncbi:unnamed protein product [Discula destructiva]
MPPSTCPRIAVRGKRPQNHVLVNKTLNSSIYIQIRRNSHTVHPQSLDSSPPPPKKTSDPLRILFCGSDHFSCASLTAIHNLHKARPDLIDSIDVLVRPGKPAGRGLKRIAVGPLFHLAHALDLPLHQRDTFTKWTLPLPGRVTDPKTGRVTIHRHPTSPLPHRPYSQFNLLIAVSFGLRVPPRILNALKYRGLNIHPSLLPDLRGPAPIPWAILAGRKFTGVTLQTLHPKLFDRGAILAQTAPPGIPIPDDATTASLLATLAPLGGEMLAKGLLDGLHVSSAAAGDGDGDGAGDGDGDGNGAAPPDITPAPPPAPSVNETQLTTPTPRYAPKITKSDLAVYWGGESQKRDESAGWSAADLARRFRAVGVGRGLWTYAYAAPRNPTESRLIFEDVEAVRCPAPLREVVRTVLRVKLAAAAAAAGATAEGEEDKEAAVAAAAAAAAALSEVGNVVFLSQPDLAVPQREFRLPVYLDAEGAKDWTSVVIPVKVPYRFVDGEVEMMEGEEEEEPDAIRVRNMKVEGHPSREGSKALERFWERDVRLQDLVGLDYAMDVMARQVD